MKSYYLTLCYIIISILSILGLANDVILSDFMGYNYVYFVYFGLV